MTTPKQLATLLKDRCWSTQRLADEIYDVTRIRLNARTLTRYLERSHAPHPTTQGAIDKFMTAVKGQGVAR